MKPTKDDIASVKARGFLLNRGTDCFSGRIVAIGGVYSAEDLKNISECAATYGNGTVAFTSRLSAEIVGIPFEKIPEAEAFAAAHGLQFGGTGAKVRPIAACKGTTCIFGNIDTQALAAELHEYFYVKLGQVAMPHKFKISVGGCPNSCMKPSLNDVGIEGRKCVVLNPVDCRGCKVCAVERACPNGAITFEGGKASINPVLCKRCGRCLGKCPFGAVPKSAESRCLIYVGGTWGKTRRDGTPMARLVKPEEVCETVEKIFLWYRENGYQKERLGKTIDRLGLDALEAAIEGNDLIDRKSEILSAPLKALVKE